ncbi:MAG: sigma 54-interacting transcriptional regulator [Patescibacteria group bacterium]|jgi:transcriptional regulator with PAS, ATPase and Fis domain
MKTELPPLQRIAEVFPYLAEQYTSLTHITNTHAPVVLRGESGTGKSLLAQCIHDDSARATFRCTKRNLSQIPNDLLPSELFGHMHGSFSGSRRNRIGLIEHCNQGTLIIEDFTEMSPLAQAMLLQFLDDRTIYRVGENEPRSIDVRIIVTTNKDVHEAIETRHLREDLWFRLSVGHEFTLPPLCDIPGCHLKSVLAQMVKNVRESEPQFGCNGHFEIDDAVLEYAALHVRGNFRGLLKLAHHIALIDAEHIGFHQLPDWLRSTGDIPAHVWKQMKRDERKKCAPQILASHNGNISQAALSLGISRSTFQHYL